MRGTRRGVSSERWPPSATGGAMSVPSREAPDRAVLARVLIGEDPRRLTVHRRDGTGGSISRARLTLRRRARIRHVVAHTCRSAYAGPPIDNGCPVSVASAPLVT